MITISLPRPPRKSVQAKDIPDRDVLAMVSRLSGTPYPDLHRALGLLASLPGPDGRSVTYWEIQRQLPDLPGKVVIAKCCTLVRRKLLDGFSCGKCRGDLSLTDAGRALLCERTTTP